MRVRQLLAKTIGRENFSLYAQDVAKILNAESGTVQQWLARGLLPFKTVKVGKRTLRRFHVRDIPRLVLISEFLGNGLPIGEVVNNVDIILEWDYQKAAPRAILWLRHQNFIEFATSMDSLPKLFREHDAASCVLIGVNELIRKVESALATARNR